MEILKNHFLPHCGQGLLEKGYFSGIYGSKSTSCFIKNRTETDRDNYMYKRIDISGYLFRKYFEIFISS